MPAPYKKKRNVEAKGVCKFFQQGKCGNKRCPFLHVKGTSNEHNAGSTILVTALKIFFMKNKNTLYLPENGMLNISKFSSHHELKSIASSINFNTKSFCYDLCKSIHDVFLPPPSIYRVEENNIKTITYFCDALRYFELHHSIQALSFARNGISIIDFGSQITAFVQLKEIIFEGNPLTQESNYKTELRKFIPSLISIDRQGVRSPPLALPWPIFPNTPNESQYSPLEHNIHEFVETSLIMPLNQGRMDAISDVYSPDAVFTISFEASSAVSSGSTKSSAPDVVRELVAFRLRQNENNHNILLKTRSTYVATGRSNICSTLSQCLYPSNFAVSHLVHPSANISVLDNHDVTSTGIMMVEPVSIVTMHGVLQWIYTPVVTSTSSSITIQRNFTRVVVITTADSGRWHVTNDMVTLLPANIATPDAISPNDILYTPTRDSHLITRMSRLFNVPEGVVSSIAIVSTSDAQLASVLIDLCGVPLAAYERAAQVLNGDVIGSIMLCRLQKVYGIHEQKGLELIQQCGLHWDVLQSMAIQGL